MIEYFNFENYTYNKLLIDNPIIFNCELIIFILLLFYLKRKKNNNYSEEVFLSKNMTLQIKGITIIIIILHHLFRIAIDNMNYNIFLYDAGIYGVAIFLLLSGYGITKSAIYKGTDQFLKKKFIRIYIPFLIMNIIWIILNKYLLGIDNGIIFKFLGVIGIRTIDRNYWYVKYILVCYIIFYFIYNMKKTQKVQCIILILTSILTIMIPYFGAARYNAFSFTSGVIIALYWNKIREKVLNNKIYSKKLCILAGLISLLLTYMLAKLSENMENNIIINIIYFSFILLLTIYNLYMQKRKVLINILIMILSIVILIFNIDFFVYFTYSISSIIGAILIITIIKKINKGYTCGVLESIGKVSFELYLIHGAFMYSYDFILFRGRVEITFFIYLVCIYILAKIVNKVFGALNKKINGMLINEY